MGGEVLIEALHNLLNKIWRKEEIADEWRKGLLVKLPKKEISPIVRTGAGHCK